MDFPKLRPLPVIGFVTFERTDKWTLVPVGPEPRIERGQISFRARLRACPDQILRSADIPARLRLTTARQADEQHIQIGAVTDFASPKFAERDDGQLVASRDLIGEQQERFSQRGLLGQKRAKIDQPEDIANANAQQLCSVINSE